MRAIFFDKDGTLVDNTRYPEVVPTHDLLQWTVPALRQLNGTDYKLFIVSNMPWAGKPGKHYKPKEEVDQILPTLVGKLAAEGVVIHDYLYCGHQRDENCECKKPAPGMILELSHRHNIDLERSWTIGDMPQDIEAGRRAGTRTVLVPSPAKDKLNLTVTPTYRAESLPDGISYILSQDGSPRTVT